MMSSIGGAQNQSKISAKIGIDPDQVTLPILPINCENA